METRTRNRVIAFRVTPAERRKIEAKVRQSGLRQQEYLLHAALETPIHVVEDLKPLLGELRAWGQPEPADRPGPSGPHRKRQSARGHRNAGQSLRGGQPAADRGRAGGDPWRHAVSSVRRSRLPVPWAASCGMWPRSRKPWTQTAPAISPASTVQQTWPIRASWPRKTCMARPAAPGSITTSSPFRPRSASHRRRPTRSPRSWRSGSSPTAKCWWLPTSTGRISTPTWW